MRGVRRAVRVAGLEVVLPESAAVWLIAVGGLLPIHIVGPFRRGSGVPFSRGRAVGIARGGGEGSIRRQNNSS
jgi:hypothetical protein